MARFALTMLMGFALAVQPSVLWADCAGCACSTAGSDTCCGSVSEAACCSGGQAKCGGESRSCCDEPAPSEGCSAGCYCAIDTVADEAVLAGPLSLPETDECVVAWSDAFALPSAYGKLVSDTDSTPPWLGNRRQAMLCVWRN